MNVNDNFHGIFPIFYDFYNINNNWVALWYSLALLNLPGLNTGPGDFMSES